MNDRRRKPELLPPDVCSALFTKTLHLNTHHRRSAFEDFFTACTATFHCLRTHAAHGPDEDDVLPGKCRPGRRCYVDGHAGDRPPRGDLT